MSDSQIVTLNCNSLTRNVYKLLNHQLPDPAPTPKHKQWLTHSLVMYVFKPAASFEHLNLVQFIQSHACDSVFVFIQLFFHHHSTLNSLWCTSSSVEIVSSPDPFTFLCSTVNLVLPTTITGNDTQCQRSKGELKLKKTSKDCKKLKHYSLKRLTTIVSNSVSNAINFVCAWLPVCACFYASFKSIVDQLNALAWDVVVYDPILRHSFSTHSTAVIYSLKPRLSYCLRTRGIISFVYSFKVANLLCVFVLAVLVLVLRCCRFC